MNKYLVVYHAPPSFSEKMMGMKPEDVMTEMGKWKTWSDTLGDALIDMGTPLGGGMNVMKSGNKTAKREVTGYSMIQAESMNEAMKLMQGHPHLLMDESCEIEIHESAPIPGQ